MIKFTVVNPDSAQLMIFSLGLGFNPTPITVSGVIAEDAIPYYDVIPVKIAGTPATGGMIVAEPAMLKVKLGKLLHAQSSAIVFERFAGSGGISFFQDAVVDKGRVIGGGSSVKSDAFPGGGSIAGAEEDTVCRGAICHKPAIHSQFPGSREDHLNAGIDSKSLSVGDSDITIYPIG